MCFHPCEALSWLAPSVGCVPSAVLCGAVKLSAPTLGPGRESSQILDGTTGIQLNLHMEASFSRV